MQRKRSPWTALYGAFALAMLLACSDKEPQAERAQVIFGRTALLLLAPVPTKATDYVPDSETVVPAVVRNCGGVDISYRAATDGGAAVVFTPTMPTRETRDCISRALPQVIFRSAPNDWR